MLQVLTALGAFFVWFLSSVGFDFLGEWPIHVILLMIMGVSRSILLEPVLVGKTLVDGHFKQ